MAHDDLFDHGNGENAADHGMASPDPASHAEAGSGTRAAGVPGIVPMAEAIPEDTGPLGEVAFTPDPEGPGVPPVVPGLPGVPTAVWPPQVAQLPPKLTFPHFCNLSLPGGCYRLSFKPKNAFVEFRGTLRVDRSGTAPVISGDLYRFITLPQVLAEATASTRVLSSAGVSANRGTSDDASRAGALTPLAVAKAAELSLFARSLGIPIYARNKYYSYLKGTKLSIPTFSYGACAITITAQEYVYTQPPAGSFNGTFPASPGTRTIQLVLKPAAAPLGYPGVYFEGRLLEGGVDRGQVSLGWVSKYFRKATIEIDTVVGAVAPPPVGSETLRTIYAKAGWDVAVTYDQTNVPIPPGVVAGNCWSSADLHALMLTVRKPATNLDTEWHMHLVVVPASMGCGRGVMYDTIGVPREGVASFCDDGYAPNESANFGTASGKKQRDVPRAFLRSACHETGHGFNQIHQEQEGGADNSIMTTTPSVANVLGGPPGVFPDDINLAFNDHVRRHLVHFPDITVRPGGMTFGSGHSSTVPQADRTFFSPSELELTLDLVESHIELGEPLQLRCRLTNASDQPIPVPSDLSVEAQHTFIRVIDSQGNTREQPSFVIRTDGVTIIALEPGASTEARTRVYWSSQGFAFETPGRYAVEVRVLWSIAGIPVGVKAHTYVWVNYPQTKVDNDAASHLLHPEVGKFVALGGGAFHLSQAVDRLARAMGAAAGQGLDVSDLALVGDEGSRPKALRGYTGLPMARREVHTPPRGVRVPDRVPIGATSDVEKQRGASQSGETSAGGRGKTTRNKPR